MTLPPKAINLQGLKKIFSIEQRTIGVKGQGTQIPGVRGTGK